MVKFFEISEIPQRVCRLVRFLRSASSSQIGDNFHTNEKDRHDNKDLHLKLIKSLLQHNVGAVP